MAQRKRALLSDSRQQRGKHTRKLEWWRANGFMVSSAKLSSGDYCYAPKISVDTKKDVHELIQNIQQDHERFIAECKRAADEGTQLVVLVENTEQVTDIESLARWVEPMQHYMMRKRKNARAVRKSWKSIAKACLTIQARFGTRFEFCTPAQAGARIIELLDEGEEEEDGDAQRSRAELLQPGAGDLAAAEPLEEAEHRRRADRSDA